LPRLPLSLAVFVPISVSVDMPTNQNCLWRWCWFSFSQKSWVSMGWLSDLSWTQRRITSARYPFSRPPLSFFQIVSCCRWRDWLAVAAVMKDERGGIDDCQAKEECWQIYWWSERLNGWLDGWKEKRYWATVNIQQR
jgi:hypothetical protein